MTDPARHHVPALLEITDLTVGFADARGILLAADRITLQLRPNQTLGLLGESGCGKSVTLRSILGLVPYPGEVIAGRIMWQGRDLLSISRGEMEKIRGKEISMIFQDPTACLNPVFTVGNQIIETLQTKLAMPARAAYQQAVALLDHVGLPSPEQRLKLYPHQLSGGMRQRVMIALAIASQPKLLLADEPTTALDVTIQDQILTLLARLKEETGMSMILVSHDVGVIAQNCDVIVVMYAGKMMECGLARDVIHSPRHPYTRGLLKAVPTLASAGRRQPLTSIPGQPPNLADLLPGCPFQPRCQFVRDECSSIPVELDRSYPEHGSACPFVS
ncbi:MAG: ABC transporter ATP-binding protein [Chloroflexi bacterium]|nr:ABC transporter ATP-binding protein [Chloroflexota bacterium]